MTDQHPDVAARLARLAPDQRAAATAPPGPILCVAPAGSGKTTTLVARVAWLVDGGEVPEQICAVTFNKRAAEELAGRLDAALAPLGLAAGSVRVRTFHALGREILRGGGVDVSLLLDRATLLAELEGDRLTPARLRRLDDAFSRLKLDLGVRPEALAIEVASEQAAGRPAGSVVRAFLRYEAALAARQALDFDDLVRRALLILQERPDLLERWRTACAHLLVDEVQDLDRTQLRLALMLAEPRNQVFLVGDDDQTIYAWRLADVRRVLGLAGDLPELRRVDLITNYRCPPAVVTRAVRLIEHNRERFAKGIRAGPVAEGQLWLHPDPGDEVARARRLLAEWPAPRGEGRAVLARTNAELAPYAAVAVERGMPYRASDDGLLLDHTAVDAVLLEAGALAAQYPRLPLLVLLERARRTLPADVADIAGAVLAWAPPYRDVSALRDAIAASRERRYRLRAVEPELVLATAHGTKGLEFDHVACAGLDDGRFPSARSIAESDEPIRVMEEERRLAYVAWTRARRSLVLIYDPAAPSPFLLEAFDPAELAA